ncbi:hypothetical protein [Chromobacterium vaccinii]|uniref:hypothetical protein n=1 Tax=Chromobacterium vaccinii TaxID=1108595 RepID=UPI00345ADDE6
MLTLTVVMKTLTVISSLISAIFWFKSARIKLPKLNQDGIPNGPVDMLSFYKTVLTGARDNRIAAFFTALAVVFSIF